MLKTKSFLFLLWFTNTLMGVYLGARTGTDRKQEFELHPEYIDALFHRASTFALFDSKAKRLLEDLTIRDKNIYDSCRRRAKNVIDMAKCVERLLDERDKKEEELEATTVTPEVKDDCRVNEDDNDGNWLRSAFLSVYRKFACPTKVEGQDSPKRRSNRLEKLQSTTKGDKGKPNKIVEPSHKSRLESLKRKQNLEKIKAKLARRKKREVTYRKVFNVSRRCDTPSNVKILRDVRDYFEQMNHVIRYTYGAGKDNEQFLRKMDVNVTFENRAPDGQSPYEQLRKSLEEIESYDDKGVVSVLSPKLFNILPEGPMDPESKRWLSPNMLSFQDEGMIPLPKLFKWSKSDDCETQRWIELLLDITGGSRLLGGHVRRFGKHMRIVKRDLYPRIKRSEETENQMAEIRNMTTEEQQQHMEKFGYAPMTREQLEMAYGENGVRPMQVDLDNPAIENDRNLEHAIRQLAQMTPQELMEMAEKEGKIPPRTTAFPHRFKRATTAAPLRRPSIFDFRFLNPFAFVSRINNPNFLGNYIISPFAFYLQVFSPYMLGADIISPRFMIATIFSPVVLVFRVLAPTAFRLMLFSPLLLVGWVLVPEAFLAKIFAPKVLDGRVLSPESFSAIVLSPGAGVLRVASPNAMNVLVLSPSFFTYGLFSGNQYVFQVLSPGIVGIDSHPILKPNPF
ncbi:unnamed protein product [Bursaphelenchus xylophilus]|uniref:(pine wood nematode) hypothetical protein n=1 Tax=Bursaphelenchus xylophilus TaxID=6326 RepID=A0A1I7S562_BURXY|nr:unnamed protein product [Bursaphelenchus xylophilus]CAG9117741.1 unnamed protein product [Bursaphelenchus xylophilus]